MLSATELKNGVCFILYGKPYQVIKYTLIKMGRGGAVVKVLAKNLESLATEEKSFSSNTAIEEAVTSKKKLQYLYKDESNAYFMNPASFEQVDIPLTLIGKSISFIKEGSLIEVLFWEDRPLSFVLPPKIVLEVVKTDPGVKGNSATNIYKPAILENGVKTKVPLFIKEGEKIRVDTKTGEYVERAS